LKRASKVRGSWLLPADLDDAALKRLLFPSLTTPVRCGLVEPDYASMHEELKRKGINKQLLWEECKQI
jgi:transposase